MGRIVSGLLLLTGTFNFWLSLYISALTALIAYLTFDMTKQSYHQQILQHSWSTISNSSYGNTGVKSALEYLHKYGEKLTSVNLIPAAYAEDDVPAGQEVHRTYVWDVDLPKVDLSHAWLDYTDFTNANLTEANLDAVKMYNAILDNAILSNANLSNAKLVGTKMDHVLANDIVGKYLALKSITVREGNFENAVLQNATLDTSTLIYTKFAGASFKDAALIDSRFISSDLSGVDFQKAFLQGMAFYNVNVSGADFTDAKGLLKAKWGDVWAWNDKEPVGLEGIKVVLYSHDCRDKHVDDVSISQSSLGLVPPLECLIQQ